jgi:hypothetical protein
MDGFYFFDFGNAERDSSYAAGSTLSRLDAWMRVIERREKGRRSTTNRCVLYFFIDVSGLLEH